MAWLLSWVRQIWERAPRLPVPVTGHIEPEPAPDHLEVDAEGWLVGADVEYVPSVRHSSLSTSQGPIAIVWHFTATDHGTARVLARRIRTYRRAVDRAASWHVIIAHDGVLWQSVPFLRGAWHCARGTIMGHRVNACSVGVELEGHGDRFPPAQIVAAQRLVRALAQAYPIRDVNATHGHREYDPARRRDPGPVWEALLPDVVRFAYRE
jgi:N-acetyl-anhydromuramyl-L-alanine amidase AmpD